MNDRDVVGRRSIGNVVLHITAHRAAYLLLEIVEIEICQPVQLDKFPIVADLEADRTSDGNRHTKTHKAWGIDVKERHTEFDLDNMGKTDAFVFIPLILILEIARIKNS